MICGSKQKEPKSDQDERGAALEKKLDGKFEALSRTMSSDHNKILQNLNRLEDRLKSMELGNKALTDSWQDFINKRLAATGNTPRLLGSGGAELRVASKSSVKSGGAAASKSQDVKAIFDSQRSESRAQEAVPLLGAQDKQTPSFLPNPGEELTFQQKLVRAQEGLLKNKVKQSWLSKVITEFLEDSESSKTAYLYSNFMLAFILLAIIVGFLPAANIYIPNPTSDILDITIDSLLLLEILIRWFCSPVPSAFFSTESRWENIIDLMSAVPLIVVVFREQATPSSLYRGICEHFLLIAVPIIRLLRLLRRFPQMQLLKAAFMDCLEALPVLLYIMAVMAYGFMGLLFVVEPRDNLPTIAHAGWLVLSTMTTVGFGDVVPETESGMAICTALMVVSSLYMAMPFGIIGHSFTKIWGNRSQILLLQGTRSRLAKWGFGPYEIPGLFALFDLDESAEIDLEEFHILLREMEIGFKEDDITELFKTIDKDSGGTIDEKEFVKTLYPLEYRYMYGAKKKDGADAAEPGEGA